jgi:hypothetical protein
MRKFVIAALAAGALAPTTLLVTGAAAAQATAADTVAGLKNEGYQVQVNTISGNSAAGLSRCTSQGLHPSNLNADASREEKGQTLVTVDVACPSH